jgi:DinB superfamily
VANAPHTDILLDAFSRVSEGVLEVLDGIDGDRLDWRPDPDANPIGWTVWHLTRIQDDHVAGAFHRDQVWLADGWMERFGLSYRPAAHGYGMSADEVGAFSASAQLLRGYHDAVATRTAMLLSGLSPSDLDRIVDDRWDPPVTLAVRLVSVIADDLQHVGQAAYVRGLAERAG